MRVILSEGGIRGERREGAGRAEPPDEERNGRARRRTEGRRGAKPFAQKWNGMEGGRAEALID